MKRKKTGKLIKKKGRVCAGCRKCVVKRKGRCEEFDEKKVYASVYAACVNAHRRESDCEELSQEVTKKIKRWAETRREIDSNEIFRRVMHILNKKNKEAAYMYETHLDIS